jgi:hypothetical protein
MKFLTKSFSTFILAVLLPILSIAQTPCSFDSTNAFQQCINGGSQAIIIYEWWNDTANCNLDVVSVEYSNAAGFGPYNYPYNVPSSQPYSSFGVFAGTPNMPPNWSVEHYLVINYSNGSQSDTITYTPYSCITGCTDPNSISYNPWATSDDGSCVNTGVSACPPGEFEVTIEVTLDSYPGETSWLFVDQSNGNLLFNIAQGTYTFNDIGQTFTYTTCIPAAGAELIFNDSYGDGLAGSTTGGTIDGDVVIYDCNGNILWELPDPNFGSTAYSGVVNGITCSGVAPVLGCTDPAYQEFDPLATQDDGTCANLHIYGCIDTAAFNYDPLATMQAIVPTCDYTLTIEDDASDGWGNSYLGIAQGSNTWTYTMGPGASSQTFSLQLDTDKPVTVYYFEVGGPQQPPAQVEFQTWHNSFTLENADGVVLLEEGVNPFANNGQGALQPFESPTWNTYTALPFCGDFCEPKVFGCMDSTSFNYNPLANTDDGSCIPVIQGCTNDLAFNYNPNANVDDGSCIATVYGCMDPASFNYNPLANIDDGSCIYFGCTDSTSLNYDPNANVDNGTCIYPIYGCTDPTSFNYDPNANTDDGSCIPVVYGCMDPTSFNYDPLANTDNGSCVPIIFGCIDSTALNFDPLANTDNGTCILPLTGCTDPNAYNYDPLANVSDSSACLYDAGCVGGPGNPYWLNDGCYAWVIDVDVYCCENEWDASCQAMYDYCADGWPSVGLDEMDINGIIVYPNPTDNTVNIETHLSFEYELRDMMGKLILAGHDNRLELGTYENGVYLLTLIHEGKRFTKRIIKQ